MDERMIREMNAAMDEKLPKELEKIALEKFRREFSRQTWLWRFGKTKFLAVAASVAILLGIGLTYHEKRLCDMSAQAQESDASIMLEIVGMENISDFYGNFIDETRIDGNINF